MKKTLLLLLFLVIMPGSAQNEGRWEYAMILGVRGGGREGKHVETAKICYAQPSGCRLETVEIEFDSDPLIPRPISTRYEVLAKAIQRLGGMVYELVSNAPMGSSDSEVLFFKRPQK